MGSQIPIGARIVAVAKALGTLISREPLDFRTSYPKAREETSRCSGTQFDPVVVEAFLKIPAGLWCDLLVAIGSSQWNEKGALMQNGKGILELRPL